MGSDLRLPATSFSVSTSDRSSIQHELDRDIEIIGTPLHSDPDALIAQYDGSRNAHLRSEAQHSCGNYLLVDVRDDKLTAVSSPSFCGGYIVETDDELIATITLRSALEAIEYDKIEIDTDRLLYYLANEVKVHPQLSTLFEDIHRLPPGACLTADGTDWDLELYLTRGSGVSDFEAVCDETCAALSESEVVVALSGGVDSAALAALLVDRGVDVEATICDRADAFDRGTMVANELGLEYTTYEYGPTNEEQASYIEERMRNDIFEPYSPIHGLSEQEVTGDELIMFGFYPDQSWPKMIEQNNYQSFFRNTLKQKVGKIARTLPNLQFIKHYLTNGTLRRGYLATVPTLVALANPVFEKYYGEIYPPESYNLGHYYDSSEYQFDSGLRSVYEGIMSSTRPNITSDRLLTDVIDVDNPKTIENAYQPSQIERELALFDERSESGLSTDLKMLKEFTFLLNLQNKMKTETTFSAPPGNPVQFPMCWGPGNAFFFNEQAPSKRAMYPKPWVHDVFESVVGEPYNDFMPKNEVLSQNRWSSAETEPLVGRNADLLEPSHSNVLDIVDDRTDAVERLYRWAHSQAVRNEFSHGVEVEVITRFLNLEFLLSAVKPL